MPKTTKTPRARLHLKAAQSEKAKKVASAADGLGEHDAGMQVDGSAEPVASSSDVKGKRKARAGVESKLPSVKLQQQLSHSQQPYTLSKSARKRFNRKTRETDLTGGSSMLSSFAQALDALNPSTKSSSRLEGLEDEEEDEDEDMQTVTSGGAGAAGKKRRRGKANARRLVDGSGAVVADLERGKIGEGKGRTLSEKQRTKQIASSRAHVQAVLQNPAFKANPFAAIRQHASNTLILQDAGAGKKA